MRLFARRKISAGAGRAALADPVSGADELLAEIERLTLANRLERSPERERRLLALRHKAGILLLDQATDAPSHPDPDRSKLPEVTAGLPEITGAELTAGLLRAGILRDGCLLVRGLMDSDLALRFAAQVDLTFEERAKHDDGGSVADGCYEEFVPLGHYGAIYSRPWIKEGGGVLAVDSPRLAFEMIELFHAVGLAQIATAYLGEPAMISAHKTTFRKAEPAIAGAWHQDGAFMGNVRALNLWLSLSHCGDLAPGLDVVPRRLDDWVATGTPERPLDYLCSQAQAESAAGDKPIIRPIFKPGDALLFDDRFLHKTGSDPAMPNPRFAIESWFFGASAFPRDYAPVAV